MRDEAPHTDDNGADKDDCRAGTRNRYFRGKTMKADDFEKEQRYFIGRRRLITRSVLGWGVVYGLAVEGSRSEPGRRTRRTIVLRGSVAGRNTSAAEQKNQADEDANYDAPAPKCAEPKAIGVGAGLALDRHGREIDLRGKRSLGVNNTFLVEEDASGCRTRPLEKRAPGRYLLSIHYAERRFGDASLPDGCGCDDPEKNYVCETAVFSLARNQERVRAARSRATATASATRGRHAATAAAARTRACASGRPTASRPRRRRCASGADIESIRPTAFLSPASSSKSSRASAIWRSSGASKTTAVPVVS